MTKISNLRIEYDDGSSISFGIFELEKIEKLDEAMEFIIRAKRVYESLKPLFAKK